MSGPTSNQPPSMGSSITRLQQDDQRCEPLDPTAADLSLPLNDNNEPTIHDGYGHLKSATSYAQETELDVETSPDLLADGSLNYFAGVMQFSESEGYAKYKTRKHREKCKESGEFIWSSKAEDLFLQMMLMIPPVFGKTKIDCKTVNGHVESMGRNQLIGYLMERHNPPVKYTRKTISSHTQVVKKLLAADGNAAALARIRKDPRIVSARRSKDFYFDERSMTLRAGEVRHNFSSVSALSRFVPSLQLFNLPAGADTPMVHSVEFNMGVYQRNTISKDSSTKLMHSCTTLQTPGGAIAKTLSDITPFIHLYPSLQDILNQDTGCDILWFDSKINMLEQMPATTSHVGIEFKINVLFARDCTDWKFKTNFYHHSGQPSYEITRNPNVKLASDAKVNVETSLFSPWWVKLFQSRILKRQEAGAQLRKQLEALQHGPCACKICLHLGTEIDKKVAAVDEHCRAYFQDMSIMQSIYAKPKGSREHRCIAVFLFKFSQSSGNQIPLTTWHRIVRSDNSEMEMISEPSRILPTQSETFVGSEPTEWQPNFSDLVQRNAQASLPTGEEQQFDVSKTYLDGYCNNITEVEDLPCSTISMEPNGYYGEVPSRSSVMNSNMIEGTHGPTASLSDYSEIAYGQEPPPEKFQMTRSSSHQTLYHTYFDDLIYTQGPASLQIQELDLASLNHEHVSFEALNEADRIMAAHIEELDFDFNQPLAIPFLKSGYDLKIEPNDNALYETTDASQIYAFEPSGFDIATNSLPRTLASVQPEKGDHIDPIPNDSCPQLVQINREGESSTNNNHDANQMALYDRHHSLTGKTSICHSPEALHHCAYGVLSSSHGTLQDNACEPEKDSQQTRSTLQILQTTQSSSPKQRSLLQLTYRHDANNKSDTPDLIVQDRYLDDLDPFSCDAHHIQVCRAPPTPPPSNDLSTATSISCQDDMPRDPLQSHDDLLDWSASIDFETHQWVVELAIAKTEDMIEEACANYTNGQNAKAIQGAADIEAMATLLESYHQEMDSDHQNATAHIPLGKILGEVETNDKGNMVKSEHHGDCDSILPHLEGIPADKRIGSQHLSQEDVPPSSSYLANHETVSGDLLQNEKDAVLDIEWLKPYPDSHSVLLQKKAANQQNDTNSPSQAQDHLLTVGDAQDSLRDHHKASDTEPLNTEYSTPEPRYQNTHYNSPQSVHSPPPPPPPSNQTHHHHSMFEQFPPLSSSSFEQHKPVSQLTNQEAAAAASMFDSEQKLVTVFTPQSIEIEMSDAEDGELTERIAIEVDEEEQQQQQLERHSSQGSYHIVGSENGSFASSSSSLERDHEWEEIEHDDVAMHYAPAAAAALNAVTEERDDDGDGMALYHH